ncbi:MAG: M50 family metallopeptidase [Firmicutes bacterium]|nr:M50 family metallopeptidase [Bacillota bacterium]
MTATSLLLTLFLLAVLILVHEFGHFLVAKLVGVRVDEFSLGLFGPKLASFRRGETEYTIRLFVVLGGFVRMAGMNPEEPDYDTPRSFNKQPLWARAAVLTAGPAMNFVLAILFFSILAGAYGVAVPQSSPAQIGQTIAGQPADQAGFKEGDVVVAIDGRAIQNWTDLQTAIHGAKGKPLTFDVLRGPDKKPVRLTVTPAPSEQDVTMGAIGVLPVTEIRKVGAGGALAYGASQTWDATTLWFRSIGLMLTHRTRAELVGPVGISKQVQMAMTLGLAPLLWLSAILSATVGLINLLPVPALDGGRLAFLFVEGVRGRPVDPNRENFIHLIGFALLILLGIFITYKDILGLSTPS